MSDQDMSGSCGLRLQAFDDRRWRARARPCMLGEVLLVNLIRLLQCGLCPTLLRAGLSQIPGDANLEVHQMQRCTLCRHLEGWTGLLLAEFPPPPVPPSVCLRMQSAAEMSETTP